MANHHISLSDRIKQQVSDYAYYRGDIGLHTACIMLLEIGLNPDKGNNPAHKMALSMLAQQPSPAMEASATRHTKFHLDLAAETERKLQAYHAKSDAVKMSHTVSQLMIIGLSASPDTLSHQKVLLKEHGLS